MTDYRPCPCGSIRFPKPVVERGARKLALIRVRCPKCGLTSVAARAARVPQAWNTAVERDIAKRLKELPV